MCAPCGQRPSASHSAGRESSLARPLAPLAGRGEYGCVERQTSGAVDRRWSSAPSGSHRPNSPRRIAAAASGCAAQRPAPRSATARHSHGAPQPRVERNAPQPETVPRTPGWLCIACARGLVRVLSGQSIRYAEKKRVTKPPPAVRRTTPLARRRTFNDRELPARLRGHRPTLDRAACCRVHRPPRGTPRRSPCDEHVTEVPVRQGQPLHQGALVRSTAGTRERLVEAHVQVEAEALTGRQGVSRGG